MRITRWVSFTWDLEKVDLPGLSVPRQYRLMLAGAEDDAELQGMITKALALIPSWNSSLHDRMGGGSPETPGSRLCAAKPIGGS